MLHYRKVNTKLNHLHEKSLRIVEKNYTSTFKYLLRQDKSVTAHHGNVQSFAAELFKVKQNLFNSMLCNIFQIQSLGHHLRTQTSSTSTSLYGLNNFKCFA